MLLNILQIIFCTIPLVVSLALYKSRCRFMAKFHVAMTRGLKVRKFYVQVLLILLLLFHYIYASGHISEWGILPSTAICAAMFSFKLADKCLFWLRSAPRAFAMFALATLVIAFIPHLYTTAITASYILLAALFYPSVRVMTEWRDGDKMAESGQYPQKLSESYHADHHAKLPYEADNGDKSNISALQ